MRLLMMGALMAAAVVGQPRVQVVPEPYDQISFLIDDRQIARYHFGPGLNRPFIYPIIGPSGRTLTRMGHPGDPDGHSHHNSVWISYGGVDGADFWSDRGKARGRIVHQRVVEIEDGNDRAGVISHADWVSASGAVLLRERRETWVYPLAGREWILVIDLTLAPDSGQIAFQAAGFGPIGVRVTKGMAVHFGNGRIRNSNGEVGERDIFRKPARWVDYSGGTAQGVTEGLTLFDHPANPGHPSPFHVREDGWMGAMLSMTTAMTASQERPLHLRYGLYVHAGAPPPEQIDTRWKHFAALDLHPPHGPPTSERDCLHGGHRKFNRPRTFTSSADCITFVRR